MPALAVGLIGCGLDEELAPTRCGPAEAFRITGVELPSGNVQALEFGFDLDQELDRGTTQRDNQLGMVASTLQSMFGPPFDVSRSATSNVTTGAAWQLSLRRCANDQVVVAIGDAATGEVATGDVQMIGTSSAGQVEARGDGGEVPMSALFDPLGGAGPGWLPSLVTAARFADPGAGDVLVAQVGFATAAGPTADAIVAGMTPFLADRAASEPWLLDHFDPDHDGEITLAEVANSPLARSLLAPDLRIDSDRPNALSLGLQLTATRVR